jgi:AMP-binding enzyme
MPHSGADRELATSLGYDTRDLTLGQVLARQCREHNDKVFLTFTADGRSYTFSEIDHISNRLANGLRGLGLGHGEHVAILDCRRRAESVALAKGRSIKQIRIGELVCRRPRIQPTSSRGLPSQSTLAMEAGPPGSERFWYSWRNGWHRLKASSRPLALAR